MKAIKEISDYIKNLESEIKKQSVKISALQSTITELQKHISLPKFNWPNDKINVDDIRLIIEEGERNAYDAYRDRKSRTHRKPS